MGKVVDYFDDDTRLEGIFYPFEGNKNAPVVLVVPTYAGRDQFTLDKAKSMNDLGYSGFAVDMYGEGKTGSSPEENIELMNDVLSDRPKLQKRMLSAIDAVRSETGVDNSKIASIGFCFGGLCVLDVARIGSDIAGVVSFHGIFNKPGNTEGNTINTKVLVLHGNDDPMVPHEDVNGLANELTESKADWQIHAYGSTSHAFTNKEANSPEMGMAYNPDADRRSWKAMQDFLKEVIG
ncbi:MAG: carboxymethylenebutenolidase [Alphaproteobacteria bacterium]|nr:carboxymethylenebutenolidase [Alphaproteobacteria bacterium]